MAVAGTAQMSTDPHVCELARLVVMVLSGVGKQPVRLGELVLWLAESRGQDGSRDFAAFVSSLVSKVGSPVYFGNMSGEVKTFFDNWLLKFDLYKDFKMQNKVGAAFASGGSISNGKEITMMVILEAMLINKMIPVSAGGSFGFGASATTGPDSPGIDEKELVAARELGKRVAEVAATNKRGLSQAR
jgi:hypothetical protein